MKKENDQPLAKQLTSDVIQLLRRHNMLKLLLGHDLVDRCVRGVSISEQERKELIKRFRQQKGLNAEMSLKEYVSERGLSEEDLIWQIELPVRRTRYAIENFGSKAEQRFLERKNNLDKVVYSLLRLKNPFLAQELYQQIEEKESSFADLAAKHSEGEEKETRGIVGPVARDKSHPILAERLRSATPGVLIEPFRIGEWWLIVRLEQYLPGKFDKAMSAQMSNELFEDWINEELATIVTQTVNPSTTNKAT